jgi:lipoprotein-releasing system permease protein
MKNTLETWIAFRYLRTKRTEKFISLITWLSTGGVALGVAALIVVYAVMTGYSGKLRDKLVGMNAHVSVYALSGPIPDGGSEVVGRIREIPGVKRVVPILLGQALLASGNSNSGAAIRGVDPADPDFMEVVGKGMVEGSAGSIGGEAPAVLIGRELASELGVKAGDKVRLTIPIGETPRSRLFLVGGVFNSGMYDFDSTFAFLSLRNADDLLGMNGAVSALDIRVDDIDKAPEVAEALRESLGQRWWVGDWKRMNRNIFSALALQKAVLSLILGLIVIVAAFNVAATLIMVVIEKTREIGILKAMGAKNTAIRRIFAIQGLIIGSAGALFGAALGIFVCYMQNTFQLVKIPSDIYLFDSLPMEPEVLSTAVFSLAAIALCWLATLYPSWQASRMDPVRAIRTE